MLLYKVASFVVIDFENGVDYISFSVFDFSALKNGTEYSFVNDQFQVNDYTDVTLIKDKSGTTYTEATLDAFIATIKVISDPSGGGLPIGGTTGQILAKIDGTDYNAEWIDNLLDEVNPVCKLGENISKGQAVYISGADGTNKIIKKASNATELTSSKTFGLLSASGVTNDKIRVITTGYLSGLNTSSANEGDPVWLGVNGNLIYGIANKPHAPEHLVFIGFVVRKNNVNGQIYVRVQNGFELNEIHDVKIESPANKNTLFYNSSNSLWENRLIGITDVTDLESALSGKVDGSGTINFVSKFTASGTIGNSLLYDDGTSAGIGTTTLQSKFHIYNNTAPSFNAVTGYNSMKLEYNGGNNEDDFGAGITFFQKWFSGSSLKVATGGIFGVKTNGDGNFGGGLSFFYTPLGSSTLTEGARLTSAGHFGIGTIYPITKFQVRDGDGNFYVGNSFAKVENAGGTTASFYLADLTDSVALKNVGANLLFFNSSSEGMRLTNSGNLAIGRTTASEKLHIAGNMILDGVSNITSISTSAFGTLVSFDVASLDYTFGPITANPMTYGLTFSGNDIMFGNINSGAIPYKATIGFSDSPMFVNGLDIGIGTTIPLAKLHIYNGNLFVESGNIETSGSLRIAQQLIDSVYSAGNPNQFLISNSVGTLWSDLKTVNGNSLVGSGNISVQPTLVSGTNIKTINGNSLLGSGDLTITAISTVKKIAVQTADGTLISSSTANTISGSILIPANTFPTNCVMDLSFMTERPANGNTTTTCRVYLNTSNSLTGATLLMTGQITGTSVTGRHIRQFTKVGNTFKISSSTTILTSDLSYAAAALTSFTLATNQDLYLLIAMQNGNTTATSRSSYASLISYE